MTEYMEAYVERARTKEEQKADYQAAVELERGEAFRIDDLQKCEWYMGKINGYKREREALKKNYERLKVQLENKEEFLKALYEYQFLETIREFIPEGKKSVNTLKGKFQLRHRKAGIKVVEKDRLPEDFFKEKISTVPDTDKIKEACLEHGEMVPGVEVIPEGDAHYIQEI